MGTSIKVAKRNKMILMMTAERIAPGTYLSTDRQKVHHDLFPNSSPSIFIERHR
jgi:hypothetical protein